MFDPSFFELIIICVVALLVLGPDRLPGALKTLGLWIGRLRRSFNNIKREIEQEVGADEIRRQLRNEAIMEKFNNTKSQITRSIDSVKKEADAVKDDLNLKKEFSGLTDEKAGDENSGKQSSPESSPEESADIDPIEKLATRDPSANFTRPEAPAPADNQNSTSDSDDTSDDTSASDADSTTGAESPAHSQKTGK